MIVEFDSGKDEANRAKHGVSLLFGRRVFDDADVSIIPTVRKGDEEERFKAVGFIDGKLFTVIHVWRGAQVRLISVRRSNAGEQRNYDRDLRGSQ